MTGGFFVFLFMMTGRGIIFICSTVGVTESYRIKEDNISKRQLSQLCLPSLCQIKQENQEHLLKGKMLSQQNQNKNVKYW